MKSKGLAAVLTFLFGCFGVHCFYLGKTGKGVLYLIVGLIGLFTWFPLILTGIASFIDFIVILCKSEEDFNREYNAQYMQQRQNFSSGQYQTSYNQPPTQQITPMAPQSENTKTDQLLSLKKLLDSGVLTQDEFDEQKRKILNS